MPFGLENEKDLETALHIANCIQGAIPKGANGGQVMFAMALLIATSTMQSAPPEERDRVISDLIETIEHVFEGRIVTSFVKEH